MKVIRWGEARGILEHGTAFGQALKTMEEAAELLDALHRGDVADIKDAVGDVMVTLVMVCAIADIDMTNCFALAYEQIKDRTGRLRADGVFIKSAT